VTKSNFYNELENKKTVIWNISK